LSGDIIDITIVFLAGYKAKLNQYEDQPASIRNIATLGMRVR